MHLDETIEPIRYSYTMPLFNAPLKIGARVSRVSGVWQVTRIEGMRAYGVHVDDLESAKLPELIDVGGSKVLV